MGNKYKTTMCKKCGEETLHRVRQRLARGRGKDCESNHCLECNGYWKR